MNITEKILSQRAGHEVTPGEIIEIPVSSIPSGTSISTGIKMIKGGEVIKIRVKKV